MKFDDKTGNGKVKEATIAANLLFHPGSKMMNELMLKNDFAFSSGDGTDVVMRIISCKHVAPIYFYKHWNPFSKVMGYSDMKSIYLNSRKFSSFSFETVVGLLAHEWLHMAGFKHGDNYPSDYKNKHSVPYYVSHNVSKWL